MSNEIRMKQGEAKKVTFLIKRRGVALDLTSFDPDPEFRFVVKSTINDAEYLIEKDNTDFITTEAANGYVSIIIDDTDTAEMEPGEYIAELESILIADEDEDKSQIFNFVLERSIFHD